MSKYSKLYALACKADKKGFTLSREVEGATFGLRMDGFPAAVTPKGTAELAESVGAKVTVSVQVGAAKGKGSGVLASRAAGEFAREITAEGDVKQAAALPARNGELAAA
jgi:hypothetical protein